jgi:antitoxin (DNA-binding transcriptional repressor) of toxin-antitoxin stability system
MTRSGHNVAMKPKRTAKTVRRIIKRRRAPAKHAVPILLPDNRVRIAEFKAHLSQYLRLAQRGHTIVVCDRETPIVDIRSHVEGPEPLTIHKATRDPRDVILPPPLDPPVDSLALLLEDRARR